MTIEIPRGNIITVDRGAGKLPAGQGLLKGLGVIWKHWVASFGKNDSYTKIQGTFTVEYPEERRQLPEAYRNMPILLYDDETGHELCTSCFQCQRICPPQVIHMTQEKDPITGKAVPAVAEFVIEYDACMSCGFCAEVCPFDAIKMDHEYELSTADHPSLTVDKRGLNRPISYYERIAPTLWADAKESATKKLQGNIRRRSGLIGIAPQIADTLETRDTRHETRDTVQAKQAVESTIMPAPNPVLPPASPASPATTPEEKAARLAAIRAANAAKKATGDAIASEPPPPADEKAARLAAIRAANAAKKAAADAIVPESPLPADEKAARLAAIRAANAAKKAAAVDAIASEPPPPGDEKAARLAAIRAANAAKKAAAVGTISDASTQIENDHA